MIILEEPKLIFIHNQKAAGMSVEEYLMKGLDGHKLLERHSNARDGLRVLGREKWNQYYHFGLVRNPWERLVSWYVMIQETPPKGKNQLWDYVHNNSSTFEEFIKNCTDSIIEDRDGYQYEKSFVRPQIDYFTDEDSQIIVDFIGRFESLQEDFDAVLQKVDLPAHRLPHLNVTRSKDYRDFYTSETREIVEYRFKKDIDLFGYTFE